MGCSAFRRGRKRCPPPVRSVTCAASSTPLSFAPRRLEDEALACDPRRALRVHLLYAAAINFAPRACQALRDHWRQSKETYASDIASIWAEVCEWVPLTDALRRKKSAQGCVRFAEAQRLEWVERRPDLAFSAHLEAAALGHPLAAARAAVLGGPMNRLQGWAKFRGERTRLSVALECYAVALQGMGVMLPQESA